MQVGERSHSDEQPHRGDGPDVASATSADYVALRLTDLTPVI